MTGQSRADDSLDDWRSRHIVLIGEMGAGKTTVGKLLADMIGRGLLDSDELLEDRLGATGASLAEARGVDALHEIELQVFLEAVASPEPAVICPAASVLDSRPGRSGLQRHVVVWLDVPVGIALERIDDGGHRREVELREIELLRDRRREHYVSLVDLHVDSDQRTPGEIAAEIAAALPGFR